MASSTASSRLSSVASHVAPSPKNNMATAPLEIFDAVPLAPADPIFQLTAAYKDDNYGQKVNLGVGAYRDENGKPWVLPVVKKVKQIIAADDAIDHEYQPITGLPSFASATAKLILGADSSIIKDGRVAAVQTISGTGANHLGALFLSRFYGPWISSAFKEKTIYISNPTWANHRAIFNNAGITPKDYPYYDPKTIGLDFAGFTNSLRTAPTHSVFLLHACAHNPTGVDPTEEQWKEIAEIFLQKKHYAFFDCAYQGFASGDLDADAWAVRHFASRDVPMLICQSYAKNAGLYGERIGALNVLGKDAIETTRIRSQLSVLQRSEISNPPAFGARVVSLILNDPKLFEEWKTDIKTMAHRIIDARKQLLENLKKLGTPGNWDHIVNQIGMFSFTGLNPAQCKVLIERYHIYLTSNGRISMAGLNQSNIEYFAKAVDAVVRDK